MYVSLLPIAALLSELYWLHVNSNVTFELPCFTCRWLSTCHPAYLCILLHYYTGPQPQFTFIHSGLLGLLWFCTKLDKRCFNCLATYFQQPS